MNYSNGKPIGGNYSGEQASGSGFGTIGMTFEELQKTWRLPKQRKDDTEDDCSDDSGQESR